MPDKVVRDHNHGLARQTHAAPLHDGHDCGVGFPGPDDVVHERSLGLDHPPGAVLLAVAHHPGELGLGADKLQVFHPVPLPLNVGVELLVVGRDDSIRPLLILECPPAELLRHAVGQSVDLLCGCVVLDAFPRLSAGVHDDHGFARCRSLEELQDCLARVAELGAEVGFPEPACVGRNHATFGQDRDLGAVGAQHRQKVLKDLLRHPKPADGRRDLLLAHVRGLDRFKRSHVGIKPGIARSGELVLHVAGQVVFAVDPFVFGRIEEDQRLVALGQGRPGVCHADLAQARDVGQVDSPPLG